jgi:ubiquinone/menaquinone biosynthesis C-methylase UbiE
MKDIQHYIKLDESITPLLCCPLCKGALTTLPSRYVCVDCQSIYPLVDVPGGRAYDFRIHHPSYLIPSSTEQWGIIQRKYEDYVSDLARRDDLQEHLDAIEAVKEIYTSEFHVTGKVLDVGGYQGTLRHYLSQEEGQLYLSVDPLIECFRDVIRPNLLRAYPCLSKPCNFLSCNAESLPFVAGCFDWIHMRSVVDHFADPYVALKEAYRVLKPKGHLLIGLAIEERMLPSYTSLVQRSFQKLRSGGVLYLLKSIIGKLTHDHNFRLSYDNLLDLVARTGFVVTKEHWQKPPYSYVIYISAQRVSGVKSAEASTPVP